MHRKLYQLNKHINLNIPRYQFPKTETKIATRNFYSVAD